MHIFFFQLTTKGLKQKSCRTRRHIVIRALMCSFFETENRKRFCLQISCLHFQNDLYLSLRIFTQKKKREKWIIRRRMKERERERTTIHTMKTSSSTLIIIATPTTTTSTTTTTKKRHKQQQTKGTFSYLWYEEAIKTNEL